MDTSKIAWKSSHASQFIKHLPSMTLEFDTLINIQKWWDFICSAYIQYISTKNIWTTSNLSQTMIINYLTFSYNWTHILSSPYQKRNIKHYQEHSEFILPNMTLSLPLKHQNNMPNSLPKWILTTYLNLLLLLSFQWVLKLEDLDPKFLTFWYPFVLVMGKLSHDVTLNLFNPEMKIFCWMMK